MSTGNIAKKKLRLITIAVFGILFGTVGNQVIAKLTGPTEHKGVSVTDLGTLGAESLTAQLGIKGFELRMRAVTVAPGGHIKEHSHATSPGLVKMISGTWVEGNPDGEVIWKADQEIAMLEDKDTVHWIYNRGDAPATAIVCGIQPRKFN